MTQEKLRLLAMRRFDDCVPAPRDIRVNCPYCPSKGHSPDTEHKLYMSWKLEVFHCFRCEIVGPLSRIFGNDFLTFTQQRDEFLNQQKENFKQSVIERNIELVPDNAVPYSSLSEEHPAVRYILSRDVSVPVETLYCDSYIRRKEDGHRSYYGPRIIFPVYMEAIYQGFHARTIRNHPVKYVNGEGFKKSHAIYNWDRAKQSPVLVVVEGVFDALKVGLNRTCSIFGKELSKVQRDLILSRRFDKIIFIMDRDAIIKSKKMAADLSRYHNNVWYLKIPWKDPGVAPRNEINQLIDSGISPWRNNGLQKVF